MRIVIYFSACFMLIATSIFAENKLVKCSRHSDCAVGCTKQSNAPNCMIKTEIKYEVRFDNENCPASFGGLSCGCKENKCSYMLPQNMTKPLKK